jgi:hypothetical protein
MRNQILVLIVALPAYFLAGCIPWRARVREPETSTVVDAKSGVPVAGARVLVETWKVSLSWKRLMRVDAFESVTDDRGRIRIPETRRWRMVGLLPDMNPILDRRLCIEKFGYDLFELDPWKRENERPYGAWGASVDIYKNRTGRYSLSPSSGVTSNVCFLEK